MAFITRANDASHTLYTTLGYVYPKLNGYSNVIYLIREVFQMA